MFLQLANTRPTASPGYPGRQDPALAAFERWLELFRLEVWIGLHFVHNAAILPLNFGHCRRSGIDLTSRRSADSRPAGGSCSNKPRGNQTA